MKRTVLILPLALVLAALFGGDSRADILRFRNGSELSGAFRGGDDHTVRFQVDNMIRTYRLEDVSGIQIQARATAPAPPPPAPAPAPPAAAPARLPRKIFIPEGAPLRVRLEQDISSNQAQGGAFRAVLEDGLDVGGRMVAPRGTPVQGRLTTAKRSSRAVGVSELEIELTHIVLNGEAVPLVSNRYDRDGAIEAVQTSANMVAGAALGGLIGGTSSAAVAGAVAGFGLSFAREPDEVFLPEGTVIQFWLRRALEVTI